MSRHTKRTWTEQAEANGEGDLCEKMEESSSRESSNNRNKKLKPNNDKTNKTKKPVELETNQDILQRRQKQIDYGKNTVGYANYTQQVPLDQRTKEHPKTPDKYVKYSRRAWDMLIKIWRKKLHEFDTEGTDNEDEDAEGDKDKKNGNEEDDDDDEEIVIDVNSQ